MNISNLEALFFDFDGVLADTAEIKSKAFAKLFEPYGPDIVEKVVDHHQRHRGMTRVEKFRNWFAEYLNKSITEEQLSELCGGFSELVLKKVIASPEIPGAEVFLRSQFKKAPMFVISATPQQEIDLIMERRGLAKYFEEIRGAPTKKSEHLRQLLKVRGFTPMKCVFFGDALSDYQAAKDKGVHFIGILPGPSAPLFRIAENIEWYKNFAELMADQCCKCR